MRTPFFRVPTRALLSLLLLAGVTGCEPREVPAPGAATTVASTHPARGRPHKIIPADSVEWFRLPDCQTPLPGTEMAVLEGDPRKAGEPFVVRIRFPDAYPVPPHWHPEDEYIVVLEGALVMGMGETVDSAQVVEAGPGAYIMMPKEMRHYGWSKGVTVAQGHGIGPFDYSFVDPAQDPRRKPECQGTEPTRR